MVLNEDAGSVITFPFGEGGPFTVDEVIKVRYLNLIRLLLRKIHLPQMGRLKCDQVASENQRSSTTRRTIKFVGTGVLDGPRKPRIKQG